MTIRTFFIYISFITLSTYCMENASEQRSLTVSQRNQSLLEQQYMSNNRSLQEDLDLLNENYEPQSDPDNKMCIVFAHLSCGLTLCPLIFEKRQQSY